MTEEQRESVKESGDWLAKEENKNIKYTPLKKDGKIQGYIVDPDSLNKEQIKWFNDKADKND